MDSIENGSGFTPEQTRFLRGLLAPPALPVTWVDETGAARYLHISARMLQDHRRDGTGPKFHRAGGRLIRFKIADLDAWVEAQGEAN